MFYHEAYAAGWNYYVDGGRRPAQDADREGGFREHWLKGYYAAMEHVRTKPTVPSARDGRTHINVGETCAGSFTLTAAFKA